MSSLYSRLFKFRERPSSTPLENFLTEGLADLFERFPSDVQRIFLRGLFPEIHHRALTSHIAAGNRLRFVTQFRILVGTSTKIPDIVVLLDDRPFILFEIKVNAAEQRHTFELDRNLDSGSEHTDLLVQGQLKTYSAWIKGQSPGPWPGAVIFLTHQTPVPTGFEEKSRAEDATIHVVSKWGDVGRLITKHISFGGGDNTYCALAYEYLEFLTEKKLMDNFVTSRDLAAAEIFLPSHKALDHTFKSVAAAVLAAHPKSRGGHVHGDFWGQAGYCGWYFINQKLNIPKSKFFLAFGVWFPGAGDYEGNDIASLPSHEPFFFVLLADENGSRKASELLEKTPQGWVLVKENSQAIVAKPVSQFPSDPEQRAASFKLWAQHEVGRLVDLMPAYRGASIVAAVEETPS